MQRPSLRFAFSARAIPVIAAATIPLAALAIGLDKPSPARPAANKARRLTYARDIAPIIQKNCAVCHHPGEVAPFSLVSYDDIKKRAKQISLVAQSRVMPPWKADSHGEFLDERRLTEDEIAALTSWADAGAPLGDPKQLPPAPTYRSGWKLGDPDLVVGMSEPYSVAADGRDVYRCFVIPTDYKEDRYVSALEVHPGNRAVVHHVIAYLDTSGQGRALDAKDPGPGYTSSGGGPGFLPAGFLGGWAPGNEPRLLPDGVGTLLPKGSDIVLEVHYHKDGKPETDKTEVGVHFCKTPVDKRLRMLPILNPFFKLEPGDSNAIVRAGFPIWQDITVLGVTPHMHLLGRDMQVSAKLPDGAAKKIVHVPDWDFNWQITYMFKEPLKLPKGTELSLVARYDNSEQNPRNPNTPPKPVTWGEQTTDEMCIAFLGYTVDSEHLTQGVAANGGARGPGRRLRGAAQPTAQK